MLAGEEILTPTHHLIAAGISEKINVHQSAASAIDEVHVRAESRLPRIPGPIFWPGYTDEAMRRLDGAAGLTGLFAFGL